MSISNNIDDIVTARVKYDEALQQPLDRNDPRTIREWLAPAQEDDGTGDALLTMGRIFDLLEMEVKTGISNAHLRPSLGVLDPDTLASLPGPVIAANGFAL